MSQPEDSSDPMAQWRDLIGGFILAFGDIELLTFRLWREHIGAELPPHNFKERTGRVLSALRKLGDNYPQVVSHLEASLRLADKRNTIAHHPMQVQVFKHNTTGEYFLEHAITSETNDDYITDQDLKQLRAEAENLLVALYTALGYLERESLAV